MALILGVSKNSRFYIGDVEVKVADTHGYSEIVLEMQGKSWTVTDQASIEICPKVKVSVGSPKKEQTSEGVMLLPRLVIEAPKEIIILRSGLYHRMKFASRSGEENGR